MLTQSKRLMALVFFIFTLTPLTLPQGRASLSSPVIRRSGDESILVCRALDLDPSKQYRIGLGVADGKLEVELELVRGTQRIGGRQVEFDQGYTANWWSVDHLKAVGHVVPGGPEVSVTARVNKDHVQGFDRVYLFISREYAPGTWYLEDGVELQRTHW